MYHQAPWLLLSQPRCKMPAYAYNRVLSIDCSTGMELILFLLQDTEVFGCNITLFGLSREDFHHGKVAGDFHYYAKGNGSEVSKFGQAFHNFELEHNVLRKLAAASMLQLHDEKVVLQRGPGPNKRASPAWKYVLAFLDRLEHAGRSSTIHKTNATREVSHR